MSSEAVFEHLLDPLVVVYGEPKTADAGAFLKEYACLMADFADEELAHAKAMIMREHSYRSFPTPAECLKACEAARKELSPKWGEKMRALIETKTTIEALDELWEREIKPRRDRVSKGTFDGVKFAANQRAQQILEQNASRQFGGG